MQDLLIKSEITAEQLVSGIVSIMTTCFGDRILSIYLTGSMNREQLTLSSDIDMTVVFRGTISDAEQNQYMQLQDGLQMLSPLRLDVWAESEAKIRDRPANKATRSSTCLYGEDFFPELTSQPIEHFAMRYVHKSIHYMRVLRGRPEPNPAPFTYPQAGEEFFGYTQFADFAGAEKFTSGIRIIMNMLTTCLTARLAHEKNIEVTTKQDSLEQYAQQFDDEWGNYSRQLVDLIKLELQYQLPSQAEQKQKLQSLLRRLPDFENFMLNHFKPIILANLQSDNKRRRKLALVALMNVQFNDAAIASELASITQIDDTELLETVKRLN